MKSWVIEWHYITGITGVYQIPQSENGIIEKIIHYDELMKIVVVVTAHNKKEALKFFRKNYL